MPRIQPSNNNIQIALIGSNIRCLRQMRNIKAEDMAKQLGLSKASYSDIENDKVRIKLERIQQIADLLSVHYSQIINFNPDRLLAPFDTPHTEENAAAPNEAVQCCIRQLAIKDEQLVFLQQQLQFYKDLLQKHLQQFAPARPGQVVDNLLQ
jgi:transcriptional regulator with XRE-family HTH domain